MSEQTETAENPGQAIYDNLSDEAKAAVDALPDDVFAGEEGVAATRVLADAIQVCFVTGPTMWTLLCDSITSGRRFMSLNVAMNNMASWSDGVLRIVIDMDQAVSASLANDIQARRTKRTYKAGNLIETMVDAKALIGEEAIELNSLFEATLRSQSDHDWKRNQRANEHRDDWRVKLAMISGMDIPAPAYVPEE